MVRLRVVSGKEVVGLLGGFGFQVVSQKGSHVKIVRILTDGDRQVLTIPLHSELDAGTLKAIIRQSSRYIPEESLKKLFYV